MSHEPPPHFSESSSERIRGIFDALMCAYGPQGWWPADTRIEIIVGAILTQNTAWTNVERAIARLKKEAALSFARLFEVPIDQLAEWIRPSGTYRVKARRVKAFIGWVQDEFAGDLDAMLAADPPALRDRLLNVPGIGPETADAILLYAGDVATFVVDSYTKRVARRHFLIEPGATYDQVKMEFENAVPPDAHVYGEYHALLVAVGKHHCGPTARCDSCPLQHLPHDAER